MLKQDYVYNATVISITDGDTLRVQVDLGFGVSTELILRLSRIDTPEVYGVKKESEEYQKGKIASEFTKVFIGSANNNIVIKTDKDKKGKYGRYLAEVWAAEGPNVDKNLNDELLNSGNAILYG